MHGPSPDDPHPMAGFPQVGFIKPLVKNPLIEVGEWSAQLTCWRRPTGWPAGSRRR